MRRCALVTPGRLTGSDCRSDESVSNPPEDKKIMTSEALDSSNEYKYRKCTRAH